MIRADSYSPDVWEAICTPMHEILPASPTAGLGALYLGSWTAAVDTDLLAQHGVRAIVECHDAPWGFAESTSSSGHTTTTTTTSTSGTPAPASTFNRVPTSPTLAPAPSRPSLGRSVSSSGVIVHSHSGSHHGAIANNSPHCPSQQQHQQQHQHQQHQQMQLGRFKVAIPDSAAPDLLAPHLDGAVRFIRERLNRGENVLVHCQQGISRSPAIVCAYLMRERALSYDSALQIVKSRRKCIRPNSGFEKTLRSWK